MKAVVKLGGALFKRDPDVDALRSMGKVLSGFAGEGNQLVTVAGGGQNARSYIDVARKLGADESTCDLLGISVTRANAELFRLALGSVAVTKIPTMLSELNHFVGPGRVVVLGGLQPGQSTNAVAVLAAEITRADFLVNATDVQGVYTADPKKDPKATRYERLSHKEALDRDLKVMDATAFALARENRMPIIVFSIREKGAIEAVLRGKGRATIVGG